MKLSCVFSHMTSFLQILTRYCSRTSFFFLKSQVEYRTMSSSSLEDSLAMQEPINAYQPLSRGYEDKGALNSSVLYRISLQ